MMPSRSLGVPAGNFGAKWPRSGQRFSCMNPTDSFLKKLLCAALLLGMPVAATLVQTGCVAVVAAGAAGTGVAWYSGKLEAHVDKDLDSVYRATQKALTQLEFAKVSENKTAVDAQMVSRTALDKKVEITLHRSAAAATKVSIRVGVFGDEPLSLTILDKIKANL